MDTTDTKLLLTTFSGEEQAVGVIRSLLEEGLIACGTIIPGARSHYRWKGVVEESKEVVVLMKTDAVISTRCMERLTAIHPYEIPEIILVDPGTVSGPYAAWVRESLSNAG